MSLQVGAVGGKRLLVLGGGLSGLSYVHYLRNFLEFYNKTHLLSKVTLIEGGNYMGGSVKTNVFEDGVVHELGPRSIRAAGVKGQNTAILLEQLGLSDHIVTVTQKSSAGKERYVYRAGEMHLVPSSFTRLFKKMPASKTTLFGAVKKDLTTPKLNLDDFPYKDPTLYEFVSHRFGTDAAEAILDPLLRGITAGDARKLSTSALMNDLITKEQLYGSVIKGVIKPPTAKYPHDELFPNDIINSKLLDRFQKAGVMSFNLKTGLQTLPEHLSNSLLNTNDDNLIAIYNKTQVKSIELNTNKPDEARCSVVVRTVDDDDVKIEADHIISAMPASDLTNAMPESMPLEQRRALEHITKIEHAPVGCVVIEYRDVADQLPKFVNSFGFLTHSQAGSRVLGVSFDSTMFPEIDARTNSFRMTAMMGGAWWKDVFGTDNLDQVTDAQLEQIALDEAGKLVGIKADPYRMSPLLWKTGIAQYTRGHKVRVEETRANIAKLNLPLTLLGQSYDGVAANDVIYSARLAASDFVQSL